MVGAGAVREGDRDELHGPGEAARAEPGVEDVREAPDEKDREDLVGGVREVGPPGGRVPEPAQQGGDDEDADRVLDEGAGQVPPGGHSGAIQRANGSVDIRAAICGVEPGVGVPSAVGQPSESSPGDDERPDPRQCLRTAQEPVRAPFACRLVAHHARPRAPRGP